MTIFWGLMIPFIGTTLGALCVLFIKNELKPVIQKALLGFAAGVMVAASVWSLLIPAMEMSDHLGQLAFLPAAVGFLEIDDADLGSYNSQYSGRNIWWRSICRTSYE